MVQSCVDDAANRLLSRTGNTSDGPDDGHPAIRASYCCRDHSVERYKSALVYTACKVGDSWHRDIGRMRFAIPSYSAEMYIVAAKIL